MAKTLYDKIWDEHVIHTEEDGTSILYIDRHLVHEVTSPQAFEGLRVAKRKVWRISSIVATADHNTPTTGWELGITGALTSRWQIAGGFANQTARITSRTAAAAPGQRVALVPRNTVSLWNRVQVTRRLGAGLGIVHQDRMFAAIDNSVTLPAFTRADAAAFVTLTRTLRAQLNIENLLDTRYYATAHSNNNIMPGSPRMIRVALHVTP